jgi:hypothetical protein
MLANPQKKTKGKHANKTQLTDLLVHVLHLLRHPVNHAHACLKPLHGHLEQCVEHIPVLFEHFAGRKPVVQRLQSHGEVDCARLQILPNLDTYFCVLVWTYSSLAQNVRNQVRDGHIWSLLVRDMRLVGAFATAGVCPVQSQIHAFFACLTPINRTRADAPDELQCGCTAGTVMSSSSAAGPLRSPCAG